MKKIAFSLIGGPHQFLHGAPVAAALSRRAGVTVEAYVSSAEAAAALHALLGGHNVAIIEMRLPSWLEHLASREGTAAPLKVLRLLWWSRQLRAADCVVALERTSSLLRSLPGRCPILVQIPHGAGDRSKGYDRRFRLFDHALVAGEKDRQRLIELGLMTPDQVETVGYVKRAGLEKLHGFRRPRFFRNERPTVLYNPHFDSSLGSWTKYGAEIIDAIAADSRFNLIVAPHVRLFERASAKDRAAWEALARPDSVIVDLGSARSNDMSYTLAADIYVGDVSSQVYEFCSIPRPCVFANAHGVDWRESPFYAMWHLGQVIDDARAVIPALEHALAAPDEYAQRQIASVRWSFGDPSLPADEIAADRILHLLDASGRPAVGEAGRVDDIVEEIHLRPAETFD